MDKKFVYFQHMSDDSNYYVEKKSLIPSRPYEIDNLPKGYKITIEENSPWIYYSNPSISIKEQGWKIHISATINDAQDILKVVSKLLFKRKVAFKHIKDKQTLFNLNSKHGNRISSGKFIAIYPPTDKEFLQLLNDLYEELRGYENGPYILNDKSWKDSNIYYRYGAFKNIYNEKGELCIKDEQGNLILDNRQPYYKVPEFVKELDQYLDSINISHENEESEKFNGYDFQGVLRFNNGGGIYTGIRKLDQKSVVIKEGRPKVGLDGEYNDAIDRLNIEYDALTKLADISGVVNVVDYFKTWKHVFLVEEFIEGLTLQSWCAVNYPFNLENDKDAYIRKVKIILNKLITTVKQMHERDIGMGDLQPLNIMITPDLDVKIIDFESAASAKLEEKSTLQTIGFTHVKNKNHKERDWYAIKKILHFCILPIGPVTDLEPSIKNTHRNWIEREFGKEVYEFVLNIEKECDEELSETKEQTFQQNIRTEMTKKNDISTIISGLRNGIENNLLLDSSLVHGDVRQFVNPDGKFNILTGGTGSILALSRSGSLNTQVIEWVSNVLIKNLNHFEEDGLFTGKAGIGVILYELGYKEEAKKLFRKIEYSSLNDMSLRSGLPGIGLSLISLYLEENKSEYLVICEEIANIIENKVREEIKLTSTDWTGVPIGLIDGWSGISLFYTALFSITKKRDYYLKSLEYINRDLKRCKVDSSTNTLQTFDDNHRLLPYLSGGSIGIGVAIWYLNYINSSDLFELEMEKIINLNKVRCAFSGGLFDGVGSFLLIPSMIKNKQMLSDEIDLVKRKLELFLIYKDDQILFPGNFCYRLSDDFYSGSAGIILGIKSLQYSNPMYWLPIIHVDQFLEKTRGNLFESDVKKLI
ncbi:MULTISPECIES: class III lanthionine synthetase LanKC [unclassified Bacillus (in: firmicutes)]|uniref:class III lanthionine synthetase LanKC n=1 Tax=unclassified Bacillus (in: firmicutes) TaxID=185979 RepID=UPI000D03BF47|nr:MULTISPECIES: class III lanthionine synthetase LanKC [unclassified Bacillus (in: firmicutes)]PRR88599.1 hypothetical protein C6W21_17800 [Bacillus sp. NMCN1]PRR96375.1 hypothetical protein C6W20_17435 [Bacillus sp. NMCN6]